jgi:hypothetical protein
VTHQKHSKKGLTGGTVEDLGLHENDGVAVTDGGQEKTLGLDGAAGDNDLETRGVGEMGLGVLRVIVTSVSDSSTGCANAQSSNVELSSRSVTVLGSFVHQLVWL